MTRLHSFSVGALVLLVGSLAVAPALAATAYVKQDSDVLKNPNPASTIVNSVDKGAVVNVLDCSGSWCKIQVPGPDGWVKQNRLASIAKGKPTNVPFSFSFGVGSDGKPTVAIGVGKPPVVVEPEEDPQVCFYKSASFSGSSFCVEPGDADDALSGSWDDNISSIEVFGDAEVTVCRNEDLSGVCADFSSSKAHLPVSLDDRISSYEVN